MFKKLTLATIAAMSLNAQAADQFMLVFEGEPKKCESQVIFDTVSKAVKYKLNLVKAHGDCGVVVTSEETMDEKQLSKQLAAVSGFKYAEKDAVMTTQSTMAAPAAKTEVKTEVKTAPAKAE